MCNGPLRDMEFVGYYTREKLIWTSDEGRIITNKTTNQRSPKTYIIKISPT